MPAEGRGHGLPRYERRLLLGSALVAAPPLLALLLAELPLAWSPAWLALPAVALSALLLRWHYRRLIYPLYTLASLLEALREGDYSLRGRSGGVFDHLVYDINALAGRLQDERLAFEESSHLLGKTLAALDSAVLVFDQEWRLRLLNPAAQRLLGRERHLLFGQDAAALGVLDLLKQPSGQVLHRQFAGGAGRFEVRHAPLRSGGQGGRLLVLNELGRLLREEERQAWQRLLRVLGHEVNNSLAPIQSMAGTLERVLAREPLPIDWREDCRQGLGLIEHRAAALGRFLASYSRLTRLPPPRLAPVAVAELLGKLAVLSGAGDVQLLGGPALTLEGDADQLEQALINLLRNAREASPPGGTVSLGWRAEGGGVLILIEDEGAGPPASDNLFVPFFTTKPGGSGIGLALARQIVESHHGWLDLVARATGGAQARAWLPLQRTAR